MKEKKIPLVFSTDENYIFPTGVVISSALQHAKSSTYYIIYIQTTEACKKKCEQLLSFLEVRYCNYEIIYLLVKEDLFIDNPISNPHVKMPTYYRLIIADQIPEWDRCICLDSDILIMDDLSSIYDWKIEENYIAGVKSWEDQQKNEYNLMHMKQNGLSSMDSYIYMGVLLMNLKKIREDKLIRQFIMHMSRGYKSDDQDVFNICCYGKISFLPLRYNLLIRHYQEKYPEGKHIYSESEIEDAWKNPAILHFPGRMIKPWENSRVKFASTWWKMADVFSITKEYKELKQNLELNTKHFDWEYIVNSIPNTKRVIVFGYSNIGKRVLENLLKEGRFEIVGFCDNSPEKKGKRYGGFSVWELNELLQQFEKQTLCFIIASQMFAEKIKEQLLEAGIQENNIYIFYNKDWRYYASIRENENERKDFNSNCTHI